MKSVEELFSENLKKRRRSLKITQKSLADKLRYSEKAISKWESGGCMPPASILPKLANILATDIDSLLYEEYELLYYLGIDGGGTKTEFLLSDNSGKAINRVVLGACNPNDIGFDNMTELLRQGISQVCGDIPRRLISIFAGIAGILTGDYQKLLEAFLEKQHFGKITCGSDAYCAVAASLGHSEGVTVIMGTGSIAFAQSGNKLTRVGGYGYLLGDSGSGFAIARDGIAASLACEDGSGPYTKIYDSIKKALDVKELLPCISKFYAGGKRYIAALAPCVFDACDKGDSVASDIIKNNMASIARIIEGAAKSLSNKENVKVMLCGGLTARQDILLPMILKELSKSNTNYTVGVCQKSMVEGALLLAGLEDNNA